MILATKIYFYIDVYFILNLIMNLFLAILTTVFRQKRCKMLRLFVVSGIFAVLSCLFYVINNRLVVIIALLQILLFCRCLYGKSEGKIYIMDSVTMLLLTLFTGGALQAMQNIFYSITDRVILHSFLFIVLGVFFLLLLFCVFRFEIIKQTKLQKSVMRAKVLHHEKTYNIYILCDTGNQLMSPYTGEKVTIISDKFSEEIGLSDDQNPLLIPYHSIGGDGMLKAYRLDCLMVENGKKWDDLLVAVSSQLNTDDSIQMILNIL